MHDVPDPAGRSVDLSSLTYAVVDVETTGTRVNGGDRIMEVAVDYRPRIGFSKITGTFSGTLRAGYKILWTIFRYGIGRK